MALIWQINGTARLTPRIEENQSDVKGYSKEKKKKFKFVGIFCVDLHRLVVDIDAVA